MELETELEFETVPEFETMPEMAMNLGRQRVRWNPWEPAASVAGS